MNNSSPHILTTSSNLLGFTFLVLSSVKSLGIAQSNIIDVILALCILIFAISSFLSFTAIRTRVEARSKKLELYAEYIFLGGLFAVAVISALLAFDILLLTN